MTRQEFANLLEKEGSTIYSFCCYLTGNRDKADDLYQETMLVAIEKCGIGEIGKENMHVGRE